MSEPLPTPRGETAAPPARSIRPRSFLHVCAYALSLPERLLRLLVGAVGGLGLAAARLLPRPIREAKFYKIAVERQLKMMTDDVGRADLFRDQQALDARTATRMTIGGTIDNLFIIGLRASPIWLLLAATDLTREAQRFTRELAEELKSAGVMREGCRLDSVDEVLEGLSRLSDRMADTFDQPPLSLGEMKATVSALKDEVGEVTETAIMETADLDGLARDLLDLRQQADRSLLELSAAVAAGTWRTASNIVVGTAVGTTATVRILGERLWKDVVLDYRDAARSIWRRGFYGSLRSFLRPQTRSYRRLLAWPFLTFTEIGLSFGRWRRAPWRLGAPVGRRPNISELPHGAPAPPEPDGLDRGP